MDKTLDKNEHDINYSALIDKARNLANNNSYFEALYYCYLSLITPNLDNSSKINIYALISYIYLNLKSDKYDFMVLSYVKKCFKFYKKNKKINHEDLSHCLIRVINRGGLVYYPDNKKFYYLAAFFFYYSKQIFDSTGLKNEEDAKTLDKRFDDVYKDIQNEVTL